MELVKQSENYTFTDSFNELTVHGTVTFSNETEHNIRINLYVDNMLLNANYDSGEHSSININSKGETILDFMSYFKQIIEDVTNSFTNSDSAE